jgi:predicted KAP-like P-loop ATPase
MYIDDSPIGTIEEDRLSRSNFVRRLADTLLAWQSDKSLVIGLYGPWGSGKSSVLKMLADVIRNEPRLEQNDRVLLIEFDPWFFNSAEQLLKSFLGVLERRSAELIDDKSRRDTLKATFSKYASKLSFEPKLSFMGLTLGTSIRTKDDPGESAESIRQELQQLLRDLRGRVLVLVDNLDRLEPEELMLVFKLIRLCSDFPRFTYVLAFDQQQVRNALIHKLGIDPSYLSKIIQTDITLPAVDQTTIDEFADKSIDDIAAEAGIAFESDISERFGEIYRKAISASLISDLRTAKRYLNGFAFSMPLVKDKVNFADFLTLEALRVSFLRHTNSFQATSHLSLRSTQSARMTGGESSALPSLWLCYPT